MAGTPPVAGPVAPRQADSGELRRAAEAFESLFVQQLLSRMREAQLEEGFFGDGSGAAIYEGMFEQFVSQEVASGSPLGIARLLERQWTDGAAEPAMVREAVQQARAAEAGRAYDQAVLTAAPSAAATSHAAPAPRVTRSYGWGNDPIDGDRRFHGGVDLAAPLGTPVLAVAPGRVTAVVRGAGYGLEVRIEHAEGWATRYAHLAQAEVRPGQWIGRGQRLGQVGSSGRSTGPHLHFEAQHRGRKIDPAIAAPGPLAAQVLGHRADGGSW